MMRSKRSRSLHNASQAHGNGHSGHARTRSMSEDHDGDDHLMHMDPSLMTERQQLAFLLRKTAHEQSGADSPRTHSSDTSDDESHAKRPRKRIQHAKTSPRQARKPAHAKVTVSTPRGRSPKNVAKHIEDETTNKTTTSRATKRLHVKTTSPKAADAEVFLPDVASAFALESKASIRKPSPSSTSDIAHIGVFDDALGHPDFFHCALCSGSAMPVDTCCEPLFLCQSCDKKYPTQRALGRV